LQQQQQIAYVSIWYVHWARFELHLLFTGLGRAGVFFVVEIAPLLRMIAVW